MCWLITNFQIPKIWGLQLAKKYSTISDQFSQGYISQIPTNTQMYNLSMAPSTGRAIPVAFPTSVQLDRMSLFLWHDRRCMSGEWRQSCTVHFGTNSLEPSKCNQISQPNFHLTKIIICYFSWKYCDEIPYRIAYYASLKSKYNGLMKNFIC